MNKAQIIGHLGQDPEVRSTSSGSAVANVRIATTERWKDRNTGQMQERTEWHAVVFFGRQAEVVGEYLKKGSQVYVEGRLQTRKWQGQDGQDRYTTEIVASEMQMLGVRDDGNGARPAGKSRPSRAKARPRAAAGDDAFDDDIPF